MNFQKSKLLLQPKNSHLAILRNKYNQERLKKNLYSDNCKTLKKATEEETNKCKHISCSGTGRINIIKIFTLPKAIYSFKAILI